MGIPAIWVAALVYAAEITLLSIGFTLTYLTAKIPNFAHGTYAGFGIYVVYTISKILNMSPYIGFPISFFVGGGVSVLVFIIVIQVLGRMGSGAIVLTIATLAIQIFLTSALYIYAFWIRTLYSTYTVGFLLKELDFEFMGMPGILYVSVSICVCTVIVLHYMLTRTKTGIAMRACAEDTELSSVLGIDVNRIQLFSWFLTGGLAALAGSMMPLWFASSPALGSFMITSIMAASLLGGFNNVYGAIIGGIGIGFSEILLTFFLQQRIGIWVGEYRPLIPMIVLVTVLLIEPNGLQGVWVRLQNSDIGQNLLKMIGRGGVEE
ncbi:MAG: branched-chain amino acid ABC transporter permease [Candidatus Bathyarchaeota archaeon]|jgi:branched-chain amino acid transport system permease protein